MGKEGVVNAKLAFNASVIFIFAIMLMGYAQAAVISGEDFGNGLDWTTNLPAGWTASDDATSGMDDQQSITGGSDGNRYSWINGSSQTVAEFITRPNIDASLYQNIKIMYDYNLLGDFSESNDFLFVEWKINADDDSTYQLIQKVTGVAGWNTVTFDLPAGANGQVLALRFRAENTEGDDFVFIDNVKLNGSLIENCGNGVLNNGEHCDDGNQFNDDSCTNSCTLTYCGDSVTQQPNGVLNGGPQDDGIEACDDGNLNDNDGCSNNCVLAQPVCGNGAVESGEQCDDANADNNDACKNDCTTNICGDGVIETGVEACDDGNTANGDGCDSGCNIEQQPVPQCGNGIIEDNEECDDGNTNNNDACKNDCTTNICGDGIIETGVEECDDSNNNNGDGCTMLCQAEFCGDGTIQLLLGEQCDDSNFNNHDSCAECQNAFCGDGFLLIGSEQCDDGNNANGDGCDAACEFEPTGQCSTPVDVMLLIDRSGSMNLQDGLNTRLQNAKSAAVTFVNQVNFTNDEVGLASFNHLATLNQELTNVQADVLSAINSLNATGQTNIGSGMKTAREELIANGGPTKAIIFLSDGAPNTNASGGICFGSFSLSNPCANYAMNESNFTKLAGIEIFTIGLLNKSSQEGNLTETLLMQIASTPADYFFAPNSTVLESIYLQIAEEICPCGGFDCSINSDQCNVGFCNLNTDQCDFSPEPESTSCEEDGNLCTNEACDGQGACACVDAVNCNDINGPCQQGTCNPNTGLCSADPLPESTPCDNDNNECTTQHCDGQGTCTVNSSTPVPQPQQCQSFYCDPADGTIKTNFSEFPLSTVCEADGNLCTNDHCNGLGSCVLNNNVDCSGLNGQCQSGTCNPSNGQCEPSYLGFPLSTPCQSDNDLCTVDHCDGGGACLTYDNVQVPPVEVCRSFFCNPLSGEIEANNFALSTPCITDDNVCTIQHCNGNGNCVNNPDADLPPECFGEIIKDAKVSQASPSSNFGLGRYMIVNPKTGATDRDYIRVDASVLPNPVNTADLKIHVYQTGGTATGSIIEAYYCRNHDFIETSINWNNQPLDNLCSLADSFAVLNEVVAGSPETFHFFDLKNETNFEITEGDGLFTVVLKSALENTGINNHGKHVQYLAKEYPEAEFRPKFEVS